MKDKEIDIFNFAIKLLILNTFIRCRTKPITASVRMKRQFTAVQFHTKSINQRDETRVLKIIIS